MPTPVDVFFAYSHADEALRDELAKHLRLLERAQVIQTWHDRRIGAGDDWRGAIDEHLEKARVILLLVSSDFLASDYCFDVEMKRAIARHEAGKARVLPIILRDCMWHIAPFAQLQALPKDARPVTSWANRDEAWTSIASGIEGAVRRIAASAPTSPTSRRVDVHARDEAGSSQTEKEQIAAPMPTSSWSRGADLHAGDNVGSSQTEGAKKSKLMSHAGIPGSSVILAYGLAVTIAQWTHISAVILTAFIGTWCGGIATSWKFSSPTKYDDRKNLVLAIIISSVVAYLVTAVAALFAFFIGIKMGVGMQGVGLSFLVLGLVLFSACVIIDRKYLSTPRTQ